MIEDIKNIKSGKSELRKFGITIGIFLGLLGVILLWWDKNYHFYFFILATIFLFLGLVLPTVLKPIQKVWMSLAIIIGWFMTRIILSFLFYLVLTPIGLLATLFSKKFLDLRMNDNKKSYWLSKERKLLKKSDYERQF